MGDARINLVEGLLVLALVLLLVPEPARQGAAVGEGGAWSFAPRTESPLVADAAMGRGDELRIRYVVSRPAQVAVGIFDLSGRPVRQLQPTGDAAGLHTVTWDCRDDGGRRVHPGVYYYRLSAGDGVDRNALLVVE